MSLCALAVAGIWGQPQFTRGLRIQGSGAPKQSLPRICLFLQLQRRLIFLSPSVQHAIPCSGTHAHCAPPPLFQGTKGSSPQLDTGPLISRPDERACFASVGLGSSGSTQQAHTLPRKPSLPPKSYLTLSASCSPFPLDQPSPQGHPDPVPTLPGPTCS